MLKFLLKFITDLLKIYGSIFLTLAVIGWIMQIVEKRKEKKRNWKLVKPLLK
jgi:putative effector of murein hydrolase LrgA (UPF0299 family)